MSGYNLERSLGFLLNDVARLMRKRFDERARGLGLTRAQWRVLGHLRRYEGIKQGSLADILEVENVTLGRHIDRLEEDGWVVRRRDPADRRVWRLHLADKSRPIIDRLSELSSVVREHAMTGLSPKERDALIDTLLSMKGNLTNMAGGNGMDDRPDTVKPTERNTG